MSRVLSPQSMEVSYLRYSSQEAIKVMKKILKRGSVKKNDFPDGIHEDISEFFDLVLNGRDQSHPQKSNTSIANYNLAANVIREQFPNMRDDRNSLESCMEAFSTLFNKLNKNRTLNNTEKQTLKNLLEFFNEIFKWADSSAYQNRMSSGPSI